MLGQKIAFDEINKLYKGDLKPRLLFFKLNLICFHLLLWLGYGFSEIVFNLSSHLFLALIYPVFLVVPKVLICWMSDSNSCYLERHRFNYFKFYYSYMLYPKELKMRVGGKRMKPLSIDLLCDWAE